MQCPILAARLGEPRYALPVARLRVLLPGQEQRVLQPPQALANPLEGKPSYAPLPPHFRSLPPHRRGVIRSAHSATRALPSMGRWRSPDTTLAAGEWTAEPVSRSTDSAVRARYSMASGWIRRAGGLLSCAGISDDSVAGVMRYSRLRSRAISRCRHEQGTLIRTVS